MGNLALGPFLAAAALLLAAGLSKLGDPSSLVLALRSVGLPGRPVLGRLLAAAEIAVGAVALAVPGRPTGVLVATAYVGFTAFVVLALTRGGVLASCGCFGRPDTPPTRSHLVVTAVLAGSGVAMAWAPPESGWSAVAQQPATAATLIGFAALVAALAYLALAVLPTVTPAAVRSASAPRRG